MRRFENGHHATTLNVSGFKKARQDPFSSLCSSAVSKVPVTSEVLLKLHRDFKWMWG